MVLCWQIYPIEIKSEKIAMYGFNVVFTGNRFRYLMEGSNLSIMKITPNSMMISMLSFLKSISLKINLILDLVYISREKDLKMPKIP